MTAQELNQAFAYNFSDNTLNFRVFENDELKVIIRKEGDNFKVTIKHFFDGLDDEHFNADESYVLYLINEVELELLDYNDDQQFEIDLAKEAASMTEEDLNPIKESTYTCKNGYVMHVYLIEQWSFDTFPKFNQYYLEKKVKALRGWYDYKQKGIILRSLKDAENVVNFIKDNDYKPMDAGLRRKYRY